MKNLNWNNNPALAMHFAHQIEHATKAREEFAVLAKYSNPCGTLAYTTGSHGEGKNYKTMYQLSHYMVKCAMAAGYRRNTSEDWRAPEGMPSDIAHLLMEEFLPQAEDYFYINRNGDVELFAKEHFTKIITHHGYEWIPAHPEPPAT